MARLFCYTLRDDKTGECWYGLTSTRPSAFGVGTRLGRRKGLTHHTVTVDEVSK